ncbi:4Fe-4S binding protein [Defluviicoccus vanus]|uniref:4Fe-4S binding protein n=1 Tax=Defluviicoccus vanus TaxID=111831 RepID=A0A7H1N5H6_9PROT|nr:4Fe-4S binding protein [Defluviicoccus vanus]QNT70962.1 4Fe-4S binding protein [Defluviicoccus vanus]
MAYVINESACTGCGSCEFGCPNAAIKMKGDIFVINPSKCNECKGHFDEPQCVAACPADCITLAA